MPLRSSQQAMNSPGHKPTPSSVPAHRHAIAARTLCRKDRSGGHPCLTIIAMCVMLSGHSALAQSPPMSGSSNSATHGDSIASLVLQAARQFGIPAPLIDVVIRVESGGQADIVSPRGAMGLMQIMPQTWTALRAQYDLGSDPFDPHDNILAGAAYLRQMYDRYGAAGFLAAYNVGPRRYEDYLATGRPLPAETLSYLAKLAPMIGDKQIANMVLAVSDPLAWTHSSLFAGHAAGVLTGAGTDVRPTNNSSSNRLPNARTIVEMSALAPQSNGLFVLHDASRRLP